MAAIRSIIAVALLGAALSAGCSGSSFHWVGHWVGNRNLTPPPGVDKTLVRTAGSLDLTLDPENTFTLYDAGIPKTGTYRVEGKNAFLSIKTFLGRPIAEQGASAVKMNQEVVLTAVDSKSIDFRDPAGFDDKTYELKRAAANQIAGR